MMTNWNITLQIKNCKAFVLLEYTFTAETGAATEWNQPKLFEFAAAKDKDLLFIE